MSEIQIAVHAPGPWSLTDWQSLDADGAIYACGVEVVDAGDRAISTFITEGATEEEEANVRLIAAAPDLLAALQEMSSEYRKLLQETLAPQHQVLIDRCPTLKQANSAIGKATGIHP